MRILSAAILSCCLIGGFNIPTHAAEAGISPKIGKEDTSDTVTKAELEKLISSSSVTLIDANGSESYRQGHIPSAIDLGAHLRDFNTILPRDKNALIVAYCGGESCKAYETATKDTTTESSSY